VGWRTDTAAPFGHAPLAFLCDPPMVLTVSGALNSGLGASVAMAIDIEWRSNMRARFERPVRMRIWIAGISVCLLTALAAIVITRAIPASYAGIPGENEPSRHGAASKGSADADGTDPQERLTAPLATSNRRSHARCAECGVVESMRQVERSSDAGRQGVIASKVARAASEGTSGGTIAANAPVKGYETTVRFRDGRTAVFNETTPRTWRSGSRVIVIAGLPASSD